MSKLEIIEKGEPVEEMAEKEDSYIIDFLNKMKKDITKINKDHRSSIGSLSKDIDQCLKNVKQNKESEINILELNHRFVDIQRKISAPQELKDLKNNIKNVLKNGEEKLMDDLHSDER